MKGRLSCSRGKTLISLFDKQYISRFSHGWVYCWHMFFSVNLSVCNLSLKGGGGFCLPGSVLLLLFVHVRGRKAAVLTGAWRLGVKQVYILHFSFDRLHACWRCIKEQRVTAWCWCLQSRLRTSQFQPQLKLPPKGLPPPERLRGVPVRF